MCTLSFLGFVIFFVVVTPSAAQNDYQGQFTDIPFQGQGSMPNATMIVTANFSLDRIVNVDQQTSQYDAIWWITLFWEDSSAKESIVEQSRQWALGNYSCQKTCDSSQLYTSGCCDSIWLPHVDMLNLLYLDQLQYPRWRIAVEPNSATVYWTVRIVGTWYSVFDFRAFPFDHQHLTIELQVAPSLASTLQLKFGQAVKLQNTPHTKGFDFPGWHIEWIRGKLFNSSACQSVWPVPLVDLFIGDFSGNDTYAYIPSSQELNVVGPIYSTTIVSSGSCLAGNPEAYALYSQQILVIDIQLQRSTAFHIVSLIVPLLIMDYSAFIVFFFEINDIVGRMSIIVALFLAISALQFVFDCPASNYLNSVQQIVIASYCVLFCIGLESIIVFRMVERAKKHQRRGDSHKDRDSIPSTSARTSFSPPFLHQDNPYMSLRQRYNSKSLDDPDSNGERLPVAQEPSSAHPSVATVKSVPLSPFQMSPAMIPFEVEPKHAKLLDMNMLPLSELDEPTRPERHNTVKFVTKQFKALKSSLTTIKEAPHTEAGYESKLDRILGITLVIILTLVVILCLVIGSIVGDHRVMLGGVPGNA